MIRCWRMCSSISAQRSATRSSSHDETVSLGTGLSCLSDRHVAGQSPWSAWSVGHNGLMDLGLRNRVYLVTGGSRGLGFASAQALVAEGARVVISGPHEATAAAAVARLTHSGAAADAATWVVADNAEPASPDLLIAAAKDRFGRLDG